MVDCEFCGGQHEARFACPRIREVRYYESGQVRLVKLYSKDTYRVGDISVTTEVSEPPRHRVQLEC